MKKLFTAAAVFVALLLIAPWGIGKLAQRHVNHSIDRLVDEVPYLAIVDRKYTSGWLRSEQEVTFEVLGDWTPAINTVIEAANTRAEPSAIENENENENSEEAVAGDAPATPKFKPPRFTVRNEILHGPVLWPFSFGAAHVNTSIVWSAKTRQEFYEAFGDDQLFRISTRVGFLGDGTTTMSSEARALNPAEGDQLSWDKFELNLKFSGDWSHMSIAGGWPRLEFHSPDGTQFVMRGLKLDGTVERIVGELYDSDAVLELQQVRLVEGGKTIEASNMKYVVDTQNHGDFVDLTFRLGAGPINFEKFALQEAHYEFSLRRLHTSSLEKLLVAMKESDTKSAHGLSDVDQKIETYQKHGLALLEHNPEFVIDRVNLVTKSGDGTIKGSIRFKGVTETDFAMGGLPLIAKVEAEFDLDLAEALITDLGGEAGMIATAVDAGYAVRQNGRVISKIEYRAGDLKINGKSQGIPGVGSPAQEMPPE